MNAPSPTPVLLQMQATFLRQALEALSAAGVAPARSLAGSGGPGDFDALISAACDRHDVDPMLVKALIKAESGFNPDAVSVAGAKGLMQLMDATAASLGVTDSFDPAQNIEAGVRFLGSMLRRYQDEALALAAYNAGPGAVDKHGGIPPFAETQVYVPRVLAYRDQLGAPGHWEA